VPCQPVLGSYTAWQYHTTQRLLHTRRSVADLVKHVGPKCIILSNLPKLAPCTARHRQSLSQGVFAFMSKTVDGS
jgi:hypothetical protein